MRIPKAGSAAAIVIGALLTVAVWTVGAAAEPQRLDCVLTAAAVAAGVQAGTESRPIVVTFDEGAKTITAEEGGHSYSFTKVSISDVSINGQADDVSLGVDRSSLGIVWQQYGADRVRTEYGRCTVHAP